MNAKALATLSMAIIVAYPVAHAGDEPVTELEPIVVTGKKTASALSVKDEVTPEQMSVKQVETSDTAKLLEDTAGVSFQAGGGVSSLPIVHGLNDNRIKIDVNGMTINSSCPNHMNPPLSYIDRTNIASVTVLQGVTPVSMGGDSIAGTIVVQSPDPLFAEDGEGILHAGKASSFYRSNGNGFGGNLSTTIANAIAHFDYSGAYSQNGDYYDAKGKLVKSTSYKIQNHAATLAFKLDQHLLEINGGIQNIPFQGFPTARMDLTNNDSIFGNVHYKGTYDWGSFDGKLFLENTSHTMDFGPDRHAVEPMPMETRSRYYGYKLKAEIPFGDKDFFRIGNEYTSAVINDFWPPTSTMPSMMGPDTFINLNNATRNRVGSFVEVDKIWSQAWKSQLGFRYDRTMENTGPVNGYNSIIPKIWVVPPDQIQALAFNNASHQRDFDLFDVTALTQFTPNLWSDYSLGYARKNRAPSLHELYVWSISPMPMTMNGWFGDGNGYVGNLDLKPETANNITLSAKFADPQKDAWSVKVTPYFSYVENFIDVERCARCKQPGNGFYYLRFANFDARLWGVDVSGQADLYKDKTLGDFSVNTIMSYVRGERVNSGNLYHMMPFNLKLRLNHELAGWKTSLEMQYVDVKDDVQQVRNELTTTSYMLINARTGYQWKNLSFDVGLDNVLDKQYYYPLSGSYIGDQSAMTLSSSRPNTQRLPGPGRSVYVGMTISY